MQKGTTDPPVDEMADCLADEKAVEGMRIGGVDLHMTAHCEEDGMAVLHGDTTATHKNRPHSVNHRSKGYPEWIQSVRMMYEPQVTKTSPRNDDAYSDAPKGIPRASSRVHDFSPGVSYRESGCGLQVRDRNKKLKGQ